MWGPALVVTRTLYNGSDELNKKPQRAGPALGAGAVIRLPCRAAGEPGEEPAPSPLAQAELEALMCSCGKTWDTLGDEYVLIHTLNIHGQAVGLS